MAELLVDCSRCTARPRACSDCVVAVLLGAPEGPGELAPGEFSLGDDEVGALATMADSGLLPPLRLVVGVPGAGAAEASVAV